MTRDNIILKPDKIYLLVTRLFTLSVSIRANDKPNELRKMIVWHAVHRHVQLHNGNLMTEATTTLLFDFRTRVQLS